jgi:hypothetical protein
MNVEARRIVAKVDESMHGATHALMNIRKP